MNSEQLGLIITEYIENSQSTELKLPFNSIKFYIDVFASLGYEYVDYETNGYQVDFWLTVSKSNKQLVLSGSLYYGKNFNLEKIIT